MASVALAVLLGFLVISALGQTSPSCSTTLTPTKSIKPSVASGYRAALVATGLTKPRSIEFDNAGNLLVVQAGVGIGSLQLQDNGGTCVSVKSKKTVVQASALNHGIALSKDGKTLYASSVEAAYSWDYDSASSTVSKSNRTVVTGMSTDDHTTRTLLLSQKVDGILLISRGSTSNIDLATEKLSSGHSQIRAFNLTNITANGYSYNTDGLRLGWGLRNSVGIAEHPITGGIFSVENSVDEATRDGQDVHENNPGEEMNFHGYLDGTKYSPQGSNYGYPYCFAAWAPTGLPENSNLSVGSQFAIGSMNETINDTYCAEQTPPRLTFQAHMAPLDIAFNNSGSDGWVTFHGSWDRTDPSGYKVSVISFANGEPVAPANSNTSYTDVFANADNAVCPDNCFRPVGLAFDSEGRMFISSDSSGEIYVVTKDETANGATGSGSSGSGSSGGKPKSSGQRQGVLGTVRKVQSDEPGSGYIRMEMPFLLANSTAELVYIQSISSQEQADGLLNEHIATFLDTDREVCEFRRICHATNNAIQAYRCGVWRDRFKKRYDMPENMGGQTVRITYKLRSMKLRKSAKFFMGQEPREIRCLEVLRELVIESYGNLAVGCTATYPSNNIKVIEHFALHSGMLKKIFYIVTQKSNINRLLQALQLILTHLELSIPSPRASPAIGFAYSQFVVYSHPKDFPFFDHIWRVSTNLLLHIANFFKHHLTQKGENTLYELFSQLEAHEKPKAWKSRIVQEGSVQKLGKHWKGTYAYLHDLNEMDLIRLCEIGKEYYFTDSIDHHEGFQTLELDFEPQANRARWPKVFESHLDAMPAERLCYMLDDINGPDIYSRVSTPEADRMDGEPPLSPTPKPPSPPPPKVPQRGVHYEKFSGSGTDAETFHCSGILHPLPPQEYIPGWSRISMMKYFDPLAQPSSMPLQSPSSDGNTPHMPYQSAGAGYDHLSDVYQIADDAQLNAGCWAYEGVVLPGGMIMLGRWWSPMDDTGDKRCMGPFIFWNVDKD